MTKIFISYRRDDSADIAGRIYDRLVQAFGAANIFKDVDSIPFGVNFKTHLAQAVQQCAVELVVIGKAWLEIADTHGQRRLDDPRDFVRIEIESALTRDIPVIPLLVGGAMMPAEDRLPPSLAELAFRNAAAVRRDPDFHRDMDRVIASLKDWLAVPPAPPPSITSTPAPVPTRSRSLDLLPAPFAWMPIPSGTVTIVGKKHKITPFSIGKYPVTNAQYHQFVAASGYREQRWWTKAGWAQRNQAKWTQPRYWDDANWNGDEQPVVGVSWYEAVAFCRWLSERTEERIMLPTEAQWQFAAQGATGQTYPWGNTWDGDRCNNSVKPADSTVTTRVQQYEGHGDSPFKVVDMAGNVWEWCLTDAESGANDIANNANSNTLRGGAWSNLKTDSFRCDARDWFAPAFRDYIRGFRLSSG